MTAARFLLWLCPAPLKGGVRVLLLPMPKEMLLSNIPKSILSEATQEHWHYTVGFIRLGVTGRQQTAELLGSGVLVTAKNQLAILTAHHVLKVLPKSGRLGLVLSDKEEKTNIDVNGIGYVEMDRGQIDADGPDIGFVRLSDVVASSIGATKSFYNLDKHKEAFRKSPPRDDAGVWDAQGFIEQLTLVDTQANPRKMVKAFCQFGAFGGVKEYEERGKYDYCKFPLEDMEVDQEPSDFGGISGGGLWQIVLGETEEGEVKVKESLLRGLVYFQDPFDEQGHSALRCHAHKSIYEHAYREIANSAP